MQALNLRRIGIQTNWLALHQNGSDEQGDETRNERRGRRQNLQLIRRRSIRLSLNRMACIVPTDFLARSGMMLCSAKEWNISRLKITVQSRRQPECQQRKRDDFEKSVQIR